MDYFSPYHKLAKCHTMPHIWLPNHKKKRLLTYVGQNDEANRGRPVEYRYSQFSKNPNTIKIPKIFFEILTIDEPSPQIHPGNPSIQEMCRISYAVDIPLDEWRSACKDRGYHVYSDLSLAMTFNGDPKWKLRVGRIGTSTTPRLILIRTRRRHAGRHHERRLASGQERYGR